MNVLKYWQSPDLKENFPFFRIDWKDNIIETLPGILIISNKNGQCLLVQSVSCLSRQLPEIMSQFREDAIAYYQTESNALSRDKTISKLTDNPIFYG